MGFSLILIASALLDFVIGLGSLHLSARRAASRRRLDLGGVIAAAVLTMTLVGLKTAALLVAGWPIFGLFSMVYVDLAIVLPLLGVIVLALGRGFLIPHQVTRPVRWLAAAALLAVPGAGYATFVEPYWLQLEEATVTVDHLHPDRPPVTIAVLADLQFSRVGRHERRAIRLAMDQHPDLIVLPGDIFQGAAGGLGEQLPAIRDLLGQLHAPGGVYLVQGDADHVSALRSMVRGTEVRLLHNEIAEPRVRGVQIRLAGLPLRYKSAGARDTLDRLAAQTRTGDIAIALAHRPDVALLLDADSPIDLVIAGHTHGGQVQIPGFGPLMTCSTIPRAAGGGGLSRFPGVQLYVSRGVGMERTFAPRLRFCCPPEVSLLRVTAGGADGSAQAGTFAPLAVRHPLPGD